MTAPQGPQGPPAFTPSGAIPMTAAPTRSADPSERSTALPRRAATLGALLAAALGGTAGRASAADDDDSTTSTATRRASTTARTSCSPRPTGTWSAGSPTASRPSWPRTYAARAAPSAGSSGSSTRRRSRTSRPTRSRAGGRACTARPADLWQRQSDGVEGGWEVMDDYARWVLMRRMTSKRQLLEVMTEFFENHLHVAAVGDAAVRAPGRLRQHHPQARAGPLRPDAAARPRPTRRC